MTLPTFEPRLATVAVMGGSVAGLLAAAALAPHAGRVVVVERDRLASGPEPRAGTPQVTHAHGLLASGRAAMESLLPGLTDELRARGAVNRGDIGRSGRWWVGGGLLADCDLGLEGLALSRLLLEHQVRARVAALPQVELRADTEVASLRVESGRVTGVQLRGRDDDCREMVAADLVVDATGRPSRGPRWLAEHGWPRPRDERAAVGVRYATARVAARPGDLADRVVSVSAAVPEVPRGGVAIMQEDDTWIVMLFGYAEQQPPLDPDGFRAYARTLVSPDLAELLHSRPLLEPPRAYRFADCRRRRIEESPLPEGFAMIGDTICSFDPTFGQGMTVAALQAVALRDVLGSGGSVPAYHARAVEIVDRAWVLVTGAVRQLPVLEASPRVPENLVARYVARAQRAARRDEKVARQLMRVMNLLDAPPSLMAPRIAWRVARAGSRSNPEGKAPRVA